jgi:acyl-CoA synthetase (AMP-forming)/AMP-acid ligase II
MTADAASEHKPGFQLLLKRIGERIVRGMTLGAALREILTFGGRQAMEAGMASLTLVQRAVMAQASDLNLHAPDEEQGGYTWYLGLWSYGRVWLARARPQDPECRLLAALTMSEATANAVVANAAKLIGEARLGDVEMNAFFDRLDAEGIRHVLREVHEAVDHTDPVLFYIGDDTLTNFGKFNNLQERAADLPQCFHRRAEDTPVDRWSHAERVYVFCVYWLRAAGCRAEEFCGRQLDPELLRAYLEARIEQYRSLAPRIYDAPAVSIADKARLLARCKKERAEDVLTYRWINGLNFYKEERIRPRAGLVRGIAGMPEPLRARIANLCGVDAARHDSLASLFDACVAQMAGANFAVQGSMNALEAMLAAIVDCAIEATGSDVGMTRGTRDVARLQRAFAEDRFEEICEWPAADYYCAVFPSQAMRRKLADDPDVLIKILYACSARMQFNHWHYMPGHCPPERVPQGRHFYLPPRMPDITVWSDQHHAGHVLAEVRYSIRSPAPLAFHGRTYPGLIDLRLFRRSGQPYTDDDLGTALAFTEYVRALHQAVSNHIDRGGVPVRIEAFDKDWYRACYAAQSGGAEATAAPAASSTAPARAPEEPLEPETCTELFDILCTHAAAESVALIEARQSHPDIEIGYRALAMATLSLRAAMHEAGVRPGDCIAVLSQRPLHQATAIICGIACGLIVNPLNPALAGTALSAQMQHARPEWLIVDGSAPLPDGLPARTRCVAWEDILDAPPADGQTTIHARLEEICGGPRSGRRGDPGGLLIYTSGTTGTAKGVLLGWRHIAANVRRAIGALGFEPGWVAGSLLPRFHTFTLVSDLFASLLLGGRTVLADTFDLRNVKWTVDAFIRHGVQSYSAAPVILEALHSLRAWSTAPAMRFAVAGAAPLKESTRLAYAREFGHPIVPCYGLSETTCFAAMSPRDAIRPGSAGLPAGIEIRVVDESGNVLARDTTGELAMRGASVIDAYFRDEAGQFAKAFDADGWFRTGDIGRIDEDGYVYVTGRKKNMVIRGGEKIYLEDVDRCLADYLGVLDCASMVLCEPDKPDLALTFIVTSGEPLAKGEIAAHVRAALTVQHVPDRIYFVERIPRTPSGKASHPELLALALAMRSCEEPA